MRFRIRFADQLVGVFLLVAVVGVAVILVFIGINQRWFARNYHFTTRFESGGGLTVGMPITLKGFEIGKISRVSLNADNQVDAEFYVQDTYYPKVLANSVLQLTSSPIGLGTSLNFLSGIPTSEEEAPLPEGSFIYSLDSQEGRDLVAQGKVVIPKGDDVIGSVISRVNPILDDVSTTLTQIRKVVSTVDLALQGSGGPAGDMVSSLAEVPNRVNGLIDDVNVRIASIADQVDGIMGQVNGVIGQANGVLAKIDDASSNVQGITVQAQDMLGGLSKDLDGIASQAQATITDLNGELKAISAQAQGTIGSLSTDLAAITGDVKRTTEGLSQTQGLVTRLLDPKGSVATILDDNGELYGQIEASLASLAKAVEGINGILAQVSDFVAFINSTRPQISQLLEQGSTTLGEGSDVLEAVKNNPLLRGGVPEQKEQEATLKSYRDEDF